MPMRITRAVVPSLFTVLNMFCGFYAIISTHNSDYHTAIWLIVLAAVFDAVDGIVARLLKSSSQFGVEIDSLSDLVSFGVAPAFLVYHVALYEMSGVGIFLSSLLMIFGGIRLARFNVQLVGFDKSYFTGLPIPASAMTVCSFIYEWYNPTAGLGSTARMLLPYLVVGISLLMVSHVKYDTLPKFSFKNIKKSPIKFSLFSLAGIAIVITKGHATFWVFVIFILIGLIRYGVNLVQSLFLHEQKGEEEDTEVESVDV